MLHLNSFRFKSSVGLRIFALQFKYEVIFVMIKINFENRFLRIFTKGFLHNILKDYETLQQLLSFAKLELGLSKYILLC